MLPDLPARVLSCLQNLETLLSMKQVERGRAILGNLIKEIRIHPDGTAEICGDLQSVLSLVSREKFTLVVPGGGFEPPREPHTPLKRTRLPIPPSRHDVSAIYYRAIQARGATRDRRRPSTNLLLAEEC